MLDFKRKLVIPQKNVDFERITREKRCKRVLNIAIKAIIGNKCNPKSLCIVGSNGCTIVVDISADESNYISYQHSQRISDKI
jgi:hypothetical protein